MTQQEVRLYKSTANNLFAGKQYSAAFDAVLQIGAEEFINCFLRSRDRNDSVLDKNLSNKEVLDFFWNDYLSDINTIASVFTAPNSDQLLHIFFQDKILNFDLLKELAQLSPDFLISSVRMNASFLDETYYKCLSEIVFNEEVYREHQKLWSDTRNSECELWSKVLTYWHDAKHCHIEKLLIELTMWCEDSQLKKGIGNVNWTNHLGNVYNFFINLIVAEKNQTDSLDDDLLNDYYDDILKCRCIDHNILLFADAASNWVFYKNNRIDHYCYDDKYTIIQEESRWVLKSNPQDHYKWVLNGQRYFINQLCYFLDGSGIVERGNIQIAKGKEPGDEDVNYKLACDTFASLLFLDELCIEQFIVNRQAINKDNATKVLLQYSTNKFTRNEKLKFLFQDSRNIFQIWSRIGLIEKRDKILRRPYVIETIESFCNLICSAENNIPHLEAQNIQQFITETANINAISFNRFNIRYNVFLKPFIRFGTSLFTPSLFLGTNSWFYSLAQEALLHRDDTKNQKETNQQELLLGRYLNLHFKTSVIDKEKKLKLNKLGKGDVDIVATDENTILLVQLKRTYFRTTTKEALYEQKQNDEKAQKQLNAVAEIALTHTREFLEAFGLPYDSEVKYTIHKWHVSNSFENVGVIINGCNKLNYFDVVRGLRYTEKWSNVEEFISFVERDKYYLKIAYESPQFTKDMFCINLPIDIPSEEHYTLLVSSPLDETENQAIWNRANEYYHSGDFDNAITTFEEYLRANPDSVDGWGSMANTYANQKIFDKAKFYYQKALSLSPSNPWVKHNYGYFLMETDEYIFGLSTLINLFQEYPLAGFLWNDIITHIQRLSLTDLRDSLEFITLCQRMDKFGY